MNSVVENMEVQDYELAFEEKYCKVWILPAQQIIGCELTADYIPIEDFKIAFGKISELVKSGNYRKFIFDKRSLRAFHQPTMEWYFIEWKKEMLGFGLNQHRKILPNEAWFGKMVEIAKNQILQNYPNNIIDQLDIKYCNSIEEAIQK